MKLRGLVSLLIWNAALCGRVGLGFDGTTPPHSRAMVSEGSNALLVMQCEGRAPYTKMICHFARTLVRKRKAEELKKTEDEIRTLSSADLKKQVANSCDGDARRKGAARLQEGTTKWTAERKAGFQNMLASMNDLCSCWTEDCKRKASLKLFNDPKTCSVKTGLFDVEFKRVGDRKWISNPGPQGLCNVVTVITLEHEPKHQELWTYSETQVSADRDAEVCAAFVNDNYTTTFSWNVPNKLMMECAAISLDL